VADLQGYISESLPLLGTTVTMKVHAGALGEEATSKVITAACDEIARLQGLVSRHEPGSEVSRIGSLPAGGTLEVSAETAAALAAALELAERSGGSFDPTVGPLVLRYKEMMKSGGGPRLPEGDELAGWRAMVGWKRLALEGRTVTVREPVQVDLGGIAKGFAVDAAVRVLAGAGVKHALVDAGGDIRALGTKAGGLSWRVGVEHPRGDGRLLLGAIEIRSGAIATSGDKHQHFDLASKRYSHIVDPRTGLPLEAKGIGGSVSVRAPTCTEADGLATALSVMGPDEGAGLVRGREGVSALFVVIRADGSADVRRLGDFPEMETGGAFSMAAPGR